MRYGSLFSGYGGLDLAVEEVFGAKAAWHAEIEPAPCRVLAHRWPGVPNLGDVSTTDWSTVEPVDVMCGGFPCTDLSAAGRRAGLMPGTKSGLWRHFAEAIGTLRPRWVVIENVRGLTSERASHPAHELGFCPWCLGDDPDRVVLRALGAVLGDLADLGFDAEWLGVRASDAVGAAHPRFRVVILAWPAGGDTESFGWDAASATAECDQPAGAAGGSDSGSAIWGPFDPAVGRWARRVGRPAPVPWAIRSEEYDDVNPSAVEWLMGLPAGWTTDVPDVTTNELLKMLGNGVVPQQAAWAIRELLRRIEA